MSVNKLAAILFSSFLIFATAPLAPAQQNTTNQDTTSKKTQKKSTTASKDQSTTGNEKSTTSNEKSTTTNEKSATTKKHKGNKENKDTTKKSSMTHGNVREMQTALKNQGFYMGPINGMMSAQTINALQNFQLWNHLEATGTLTAETKNALMKGTTASNRTSENYSQSQSYNSADLTTGSVGQNNITNKDEVEQVQMQLADLGYNPGDANGMMSSDTRQAIREFQWFNDMPITGNLDQSTRAAIGSQDQGVASAQLSQSSSSVVREKPAVPSSSESGQTSQNTATTTNDQYSDQNKTTKHSHEKVSGKSERDASERVTKAAEVLHDLSSTSDRKIPDEILEQAEGIAVIPHMIKGAFGIGGRYGKGVVSERTQNGRWSPPAFIEVGGGSFGAQLGVESTDLVLVFTDRAALDKLAKGLDLKLGVDAGVAAGPVGRHGEAGVNANLKSAIYSYSRSKGLFAGVALDGAVLNIEKSMNEKVYGSSVDAQQILNGRVTANAIVQPFMDELKTLMPAKRISQK